MFKNLVGVLLVVGAVTVMRIAPVSAQGQAPLAGLQVLSDGAAQARLSGLQTSAGAERWMPRRAEEASGLSSKQEGRDPTTVKKGRKVMWIALAASAAAVALAVRFAPEPQIPATPSGGFRCTSFYRPGTLQTVSGYTCVSR